MYKFYPDKDPQIRNLYIPNMNFHDVLNLSILLLTIGSIRCPDRRFYTDIDKINTINISR